MNTISKSVMLLFVLKVISYSVSGQTFDGVGGLPFPPSGTTGITQSTNDVSGVGVIGGCTYIDNVTIDLNHTWVGDIAFFLIAPNGVFIELSSGNGGPGDNFSGTVFTDFAPINIISGAPPFIGNYQPEGRQNTTLAPPFTNAPPAGTFTFANTFNGVNADGTWILYLNDYVPADAGFLNSWSITFVNGGSAFTVDLGPDQIVCAGDDITLNANNTATNPSGYLWNNGTTNPTLQINNIATTATYTVTVTDASGCTATDQVLITVNPAPQAFPMSLGACEISGTGQALFDLTLLNSSISPPPNTGTVTYYFDIGATSPIPNPTTFLSGSTTVYATVSNGTCTSDPVAIVLVMTSSDPNQYSMNIVEDQICGGLFTVLFTFPNPGAAYTIEYILTCGGNSTSTTITTSANPIIFTTLEDCTLEILRITPQNTSCNVIFSPPLIDNIVVNSPPNITTNSILQCPGDVIDLSDFVTAEPGSTVTFHNGNPPNSSNQIPSFITVPSSSTTYYVLADNGCPAVAPITVNVSPGGPTFNTVIPLCETSSTIDLSTYVMPVGLSGVWSGDGVSGNSFNPSGLTGLVSLTFTPVNECYDDGMLVINLIPDQNINLLTATICSSGDLLDLATLTDPLIPNGLWSGPGTAGGFFNPSLTSGTVTLTFTPSNVCVTPSTTTVTVLPNPSLQVQPNIIVCQGSVIDLNDYVINPSNFTLNFYNNLPAIPSNEILNPIFTISSNSTFYVKITDGDGCFTIAPILITVTPGGVPNLGTATLCQSQLTLNLNALNDPNAGSGIWSGTGVTGNIIDLTSVVGIINLIFTPDNTCFTVSDTDVEVLVPQNPILGTDELCSSNGNYNLINIADPAYISGVWSGVGVSSNIFNPINLSGTYTLTFDPDQFCVNNASTQILVTPSQTPNLGSISICETQPNFDLSTIADPLYSSGVWSGPGVNGSIFESAGLQGINLITFTSDENCVFPSITTISVNSLQTPQLQTLSLCETSNPVDLSFYADPLYTSGIWTGPGVLNGYFDPSGLLGVNQLTFIAADNCTLPSFTSATINSAPIVSDIVTICDQNTQTFTVQFTITGGDNTTYTVNNNPSSGVFISSSLPSQSNYTFTINDINQCPETVVQGTKNCDCKTEAGTMKIETNPISVCVNQTATATFNDDAILENDDRLIFILHDNAGPNKGNILSTSKTPSFTFPSNGSLGTTYYISAAVADSILLDSIDFADACLAVAAGVPVVFYEPVINLQSITDICVNDCVNQQFSIQGEGPFRFESETWINGTLVKKDTINTLNTTFNTTFCPADFDRETGIVEIKIIDFKDKNCLGLRITEAQTFNIYPERITNINNRLCRGENIQINGKTYDESTPVGTEIILSSVNGQCDSIINIALQFVESNLNIINDQLCVTQSLLVNGKIYDVNNATGTETIVQGSYLGCDSVIQVNLVFTDEIITNVSPLLCPGENYIVNGNVYDQNKLSGTEIIKSNDGTKCDSVIIVALRYKMPVTNEVNVELCDEESLVINSKIYNKSNPSGTEIIRNGAANGCDSIVNIALRFKNPIVSNADFELCDNESYEVNGKTFTKSNPTGREVIYGGAISGCDSIINIDLKFLPKIEGRFVDTLCVGQTIEINGQIYDETKLNGNFTLPNAAQSGCDSTVVVDIFFYEESLDTVVLIIKKGESITYNGVIFDENNIQQLTTRPELTNNGCLQFTLVRLEFEQEFITYKVDLQAESCPQKNDGSIIIQEIKGCKNFNLFLNNNPINYSSFPIVISDLSPGSYTLLILGDTDCRLEEPLNIAASVSKDFDVKLSNFTVKKGESLTLDPIISPQPITIEWIPADNLSCSDCLTPIYASAQQDQQYIINLTNSEGCLYTRTISVNVNEPINNIVFPNIFSPNGDGNNDTWEVLFTDNQRISRLAIFDRWGNQVFNIVPPESDLSVVWNGKMGSQEVVPGVYIYQAQVTDKNGKSTFITNDITILR